MPTSRSSTVLGPLLAVVVMASPPAGSDGVIQVFASTFNELADKLEPIRFASPTNGPAHPIRVKIPFDGTKTVCGGHWRADVTNVDFTISTAGGVRVSGPVHATWTCGPVTLPFDGTFSTNATVTYNATVRVIQTTVNSANVHLCFSGTLSGILSGIGIDFCRDIDISTGLNFPPIPVRGAAFHFETAAGPTLLRLTPQNVVVTPKDGFVEVQGDVTLW